MGGDGIILWYVNSCASGKLGISECGPVWQMLVIATFLIVAIVVLLVLRLRPRAQSAEG